MIITVTGASGSGKSFITNYLCSLNEKIVYLSIDEIGHEVLLIPEVIDELVNTFRISLTDGKVDRKELGNIVFNNRDKMDKLTDMTWRYMEKMIDNFIKNNKDKIILLDWILITKTKYFEMASLNILVKADFNVRAQRAMKRDNISLDKFKEREKASISYDESAFNYIVNNNEIEETRKLVKSIYDKSIVSG